MGNNFGYISGDWRADPLRLGYSGTQAEAISGTAVSGYNSLVSSTVPAGQLWNVQVITGVETPNAPVALNLAVVISGILIYLLQDLAPAAGVRDKWFGSLVLHPGDYLVFEVSGAIAGDTITMKYAGIIINTNK